MGIQSVCRVKAKIKPVKPDGTTEPELVVPYYFRGSNVYLASTAVKDSSLIENIPSDKFNGTIPLPPVADLIRAGIVSRIGVVVEDPNSKKRRRYSLVVDAEQKGAIFDNATKPLDGADWILTNRNNTTKNMGKIIKLTERTEAYNP